MIKGGYWVPQQESYSYLIKCRCLMGDQWKNLALSAHFSLGFNRLTWFVLERKPTLAPDFFPICQASS